MTKKRKVNRKGRVRKRTPKSAIRTEITGLQAQMDEVRKFVRTKSCTPEDRVHMDGFINGLYYGLRSLELLHAESALWCEDREKRK